MIAGIFLFLVALAVVQFVLLKRKAFGIEQLENRAKVAELRDHIRHGQINLVDNIGNNILMIAAMEHGPFPKGDPTFNTVIEDALTAGIDVNAQNQINGDTALNTALISKENESAVHLLLQRGANVNLANHHGKTALFYVIDRSKSLYDSVVQRITHIDAPDTHGDTPLLYAASRLNGRVIDDLVARGANPKHRNSAGKNMFHLADANKAKYYRHSGNSAQKHTYGEHNHRINELVRRIHCMVNDKPFKPKRYVPPNSDSDFEVE